MRLNPILLALSAPLLVGGCSRLPGGHSNGATPPVRFEQSAPGSFVRSTAEARTTRTLPVREGMTKAALWRAALDVLNEKHTVEVRDQSAGFAMTAWEASMSREGVPDLRYRTRLIVDFLGEDWKQVTVRSEAQWRQSGDEWEVGYDSALLDEVVKDFVAKLAKPVSAR